ncbi:MAG TPA: phasin family protein [Steroidobacteraceae bacterium]|nr:phasin family protein [Steroidobacteraceae bacterium]
MSDSTFDPKAIFEAYRNAFAPTLKAQQEAVKAIDRLGRYQYAVAGDYLEWSLAQAKAALATQTPSEFVTKQVELTTALSEKLRARAQEFVTLATDAQTSAQSTFTEAVNVATAKFGDAAKFVDATKFGDAAKKKAS